MTPDAYVQSVVDFVPSGLPLRDQIAMELRSHIAERAQEGRPIDEILAQLGDPLTLAESYLAAVPLANASVGGRLAAKIIDFILVFGVAAAVGCAGFFLLPDPVNWFAPQMALFFGVIGFVLYTALAEYRTGRTLGKRLMGIRVVRESGARIALGQAFLRQLPWAGIFFIDAVFALFTDRKQRAFELLTKTRAVALLGVGLLTRS
jgi:uncharacterized RDD family membrane protein YckC